MATTLLESYELLIQVEQLAPRLEAAAKALAQLPDLEDEKGWLASACARLEAVRSAAHGELLNRAIRLPELEGLRGERGKLLQGAIADEVERLQAGITHVGGARAALLEVLFVNLKMPTLRKSSSAETDKFCAEIERRLASSYARRVFSAPPYAALVPTVKSLLAAIATWRSVFIDPPVESDVAEALRTTLLDAAGVVERSMRQARLLAQAALLPAAELLDAAGLLTAKAKRRGKDDPDTHAMLETDPPDPHAPTPTEQAELADADR